MIEWIFLLSVVSGLRLTSIDIPSSVNVGDAVRLNCAYDLERDILYSVKWYRDSMEFYRYIPNDRPSIQFFSLPGISIDSENSINGTVYLQDVSISSSGLYRCEVSSDAPSFQTVAAEKTMNVEMLPH